MKSILFSFLSAVAVLMTATPVFGAYPDVYLRGDFNNTTWRADSRYKFTCDEGVYTLTISAANPVGPGCKFKIGDAEWQEIDLGGSRDNVTIDNTQTIQLMHNGANLRTEYGLTDAVISFTYPGAGNAIVNFTIAGTDPKDPTGISGTLPVLYINVYTDENHTAYNNEVISKDLGHKNYFEFAEYWLDMKDCQWLKDLGGENVGSAEKPLPLQIKARGNWTRIGFAKKPFKLKLDKKQNLLGLTPEKSKHYAILAHADDNKGYLRNFTGFNLGERIGLPWTPRQQPVEVVINGDYRGLYFLTESIRVQEGRVEIEELADFESDPYMASGGYLVELDNYNEETGQIRMEEATHPSMESPRHNVDLLRITFDTPEQYSPIQQQFVSDQFAAMNECVGKVSDDLWKYMDLDDAARYYLVEEIVSHVESYHGSTYLFRDRGEGRKWHFSPLWDFGNAFNGYTDAFLYDCDPFGNTWIPSMRLNGKFNAKVRETWLWFMSNCFEGLYDDIDEYVSHLRGAAQADYDRWHAAAVPGGGQPVADNRDLDARKSEVKAHLESKIGWLKAQFGDFTSGSHPEPERDDTEAAPLPDYILAGVDGVDAPEGEAEWYTLEGIRVAHPQKGSLYIVRTPGAVRKILY